MPAVASGVAKGTGCWVDEVSRMAEQAVVGLMCFGFLTGDENAREILRSSPLLFAVENWR